MVLKITDVTVSAHFGNWESPA